MDALPRLLLILNPAFDHTPTCTMHPNIRNYKKMSSSLQWYLCKTFLWHFFQKVVVAVDGPMKERDLIGWMLLSVWEEACLAHLDYLLGLQYLISRILWVISPKATLHLIYKDWLPGKSRRESALSSEGQLKKKGFNLVKRVFSSSDTGSETPGI